MAHLEAAASQIFGRGRPIIVIDHTQVSSAKGLLSLLPQQHIQPETINVIYKLLCDIIDSLGQASAYAQGLPSVITSASKLASSSDQKVYLSIDLNLDRIVGLLKIGRKRLFLSDPRRNDTFSMAMIECQPLCILDFYVVEGQQRRGVGRRLFDAMLSAEGAFVGYTAVDRPSPKMISFLAKNYGLNRPHSQRNNFTVFDSFFDPNNPALSRTSSSFRRNLRKSFSSDCISEVRSALGAADQEQSINTPYNNYNANSNQTWQQRPVQVDQGLQLRQQRQQQTPTPRALPPLPVPRSSAAQPQSADMMLKNKQVMAQARPLQPSLHSAGFADMVEPPLLTRDILPEGYRRLLTAAEKPPLSSVGHQNNSSANRYFQPSPMPPKDGYYSDTEATNHLIGNGMQQPRYANRSPAQAAFRSEAPSWGLPYNVANKVVSANVSHYYTSTYNNSYKYPRSRLF